MRSGLLELVERTVTRGAALRRRAVNYRNAVLGDREDTGWIRAILHVLERIERRERLTSERELVDGTSNTVRARRRTRRRS